MASVVTLATIGLLAAMIVVIGLVLLGIYLLISRTRRRSAEDYWKRRQWEQDLRANDPDMAPPGDDDER